MCMMLFASIPLIYSALTLPGNAVPEPISSTFLSFNSFLLSHKNQAKIGADGHV